MNSNNATPTALQEWAVVARLELEMTVERLSADPDFQEWAASRMEEDNATRGALKWTLEDYVGLWVRHHGSNLEPLPIPQPEWSSTRELTPPDLRTEGDMWALHDEGQIGRLRIYRSTYIGQHGRIEESITRFSIDDLSETLDIDANELDDVIILLQNARNLLRGGS